MIDTALVRRRRLELGLSRRAVARAVGLSEGAVSRVEVGGDAADWTLRQLGALATALAVDVAHLVADSECASDEAGREDAAVVGALLARCHRLTPTSTLAHATGWDLARVNRALRALGHEAPRVGQRLHRLRGAVALRHQALAVDDASLERLLQRELGRTRLTSTQVKILHDVRAGTVDEQRFSEADRVAFAALLNAGLVDASGDAPVLTEAARFSLGGDDLAA